MKNSEISALLRNISSVIEDVATEICRIEITDSNIFSITVAVAKLGTIRKLIDGLVCDDDEPEKRTFSEVVQDVIEYFKGNRTPEASDEE